MECMHDIICHAQPVIVRVPLHVLSHSKQHHGTGVLGDYSGESEGPLGQLRILERSAIGQGDRRQQLVSHRGDGAEQSCAARETRGAACPEEAFRYLERAF